MGFGEFWEVVVDGLAVGSILPAAGIVVGGGEVAYLQSGEAPGLAGLAGEGGHGVGVEPLQVVGIAGTALHERDVPSALTRDGGGEEGKPLAAGIGNALQRVGQQPGVHEFVQSVGIDTVPGLVGFRGRADAHEPLLHGLLALRPLAFKADGAVDAQKTNGAEHQRADREQVDVFEVILQTGLHFSFFIVTFVCEKAVMALQS